MAFPYDDGYEGRYAEADAHKALEELRTDGVACLCLSIGAATDTDALKRVFGSASYASAATLADLSPQMDELFLRPSANSPHRNHDEIEIHPSRRNHPCRFVAAPRTTTLTTRRYLRLRRLSVMGAKHLVNSRATHSESRGDCARRLAAVVHATG